MTNSEVDRLIAEYEKIAVPDEQIDFSDCPELTDEQLKSARPLHSLHPRNTNAASQKIIIRINRTLADHLHSIGGDWESKVNDVLMNAYAAGQI